MTIDSNHYKITDEELRHQRALAKQQATRFAQKFIEKQGITNSKKSKLAKKIKQNFMDIISYSEALDLAQFAIGDYYREHNIEPRFIPASKYVYPTKEKTSLIDGQAPKITTKIEKRSSTTTESQLESQVEIESQAKNGTTPVGNSQNRIRLDDRDRNIIFQFSTPKVAAYVKEYLNIPKSTFYRKLSKLMKLRLIEKLDDNKLARYSITLELKNFFQMGLVKGLDSSLIFELTSQMPSIKKSKHLVQDRQSQSQSCIVSHSSISKKDENKSGTSPETTSQKASNSQNSTQNETLGMDPSASSVPISSKSKKPREKSETNYPTTSKKPLFQELIQKFDPNRLRSHAYLYSIEIKKSPPKFTEQLEQEGTWLIHNGMRNWPWYYREFIFDNIKTTIRIYPKRINIRLLELWGTDAEVNDANADLIVAEIEKYLAQEYHLILGARELIDRSPVQIGKTTIKKTHHAIPFHPVAIAAIEASYRIKTRDWEIDNSQNLRELEAINPTYSTYHVKKYVENCLQYMSSTDRWIEDLDSDIRDNKEVSEAIFENIAINNHSTQKNGQSLQTVLQKVDALSNEVRAVNGSVFKDQEFQQNILASLDHIASFLGDLNVKQTETNVILSQTKQSQQSESPHMTISKANLKFRPSEQKIYDLLQKNPGISRRELIKDYGFSQGTVKPIISKFKKLGLIREEKASWCQAGRLYLQ